MPITKPRTQSNSSPGPATAGELLALADRALTTRLPAGWSLETESEPTFGSGPRPDAVIAITAPDGTSAALLVDVKQRLDSVRGTRAAAEKLDDHLREALDRGMDAYGVLIAPYLSPASRELLIDRGIGFVDATGNVRVACDRPALFIESHGASRDPQPQPSSLQSLKGSAAGAAVRALVDFVPPYGIRALAERARISAATLSRVVALLERDGLVERKPRGPVERLDWEAAIRRWTADYGVTETNRYAGYLEPRGLDALAGKLRDTERRYAVTGSMGLPDDVSIAPARLAMVYTPDVVGLASTLDLRPTDGGTNVLLLEPFDDVVFARTSQQQGFVAVAYSQLAADLLTGPGRAPAEGDELLTWMKDDEDAWRTRP